MNGASRRSWRQIWLTVHSWIGLSAGLLFALLGLTGSVLVFDHAIDEWLNPKLLLTEKQGTPRPLAQIVAAAERAHPSVEAYLVELPRVPGGVCVVYFDAGPTAGEVDLEAAVDPVTTEVLGSRIWGAYPTSWIYDLHYTLLAGDTGHTIVGVAGIVLLVSLCSGAYLWWPLMKSGLRAGFAVRSGKRNYDIHKVVGAVSATVLLVVAFTGVYLVFPWMIEPAATAFSQRTSWPKDPHSSVPTQPAAARIDVDSAAATARRAFPAGDLKAILLPKTEDDAYSFWMRHPGDVRISGGESVVWVDQYSGQSLAIRDSRQSTAADAFLSWQFPLHNGEAFGLVGRWIVFVSGLAPAVLYVTGCGIWWRKRRSRRRREAARTA